MSKEQYIEDLKEIKEIMNRSSRVISLSGLSGVSIGIIAIVASILAHTLVFKSNLYLVLDKVDVVKSDIWTLLLIASVTLLTAIVSAVYFTRRKNKEENNVALDIQSKQLLAHLFIPLITGGILCLLLLFKGFVGWLAPFTLIFYGLALVNGSKYTFTKIRNLGLIEISTGLASILFIEYALYFWAFGFGAVQIIYGLIIHKKN